MVSDICGFTAFCAARTPADVVNLLSDIYTEFDKLCDKFGVYKVCTIGDAYVIIAGLPHIEQQLASQRTQKGEPEPTNKLEYGCRLMEMALAMVNETRRKGAELGFDFNMRIGIHFGKVVMGVIGTTKLRYDIWGTDVMLASLCESEGEPGAIHISSSAYNRGNLKAHFKFTKHKVISIPGAKGQSTYLHTLPPPSTVVAEEALVPQPDVPQLHPSPEVVAPEHIHVHVSPVPSAATLATVSNPTTAERKTEAQEVSGSASPTASTTLDPLLPSATQLSDPKPLLPKQLKPSPPPEPPPSPPPSEPPNNPDDYEDEATSPSTVML